MAPTVDDLDKQLSLPWLKFRLHSLSNRLVKCSEEAQQFGHVLAKLVSRAAADETLETIEQPR